MATLLLKIGKRQLQKCTFNRKEALFTPSDSGATGYLCCAVRGTILLPGTGVLKSSDISFEWMIDSAVCAFAGLLGNCCRDRETPGSPKPDHRECPSHPKVSCPNFASPKPRATSILSRLVNFTRSQASILAARLSVEEISSTFPSKPKLCDHPRRFRDERWPARIPAR